jgi:hypothetical protein
MRNLGRRRPVTLRGDAGGLVRPDADPGSGGKRSCADTGLDGAETARRHCADATHPPDDSARARRRAQRPVQRRAGGTTRAPRGSRGAILG